MRLWPLIQGVLEQDLFLHRHVAKIYENVRKKALVQYFSTFSSVDMNQMAETFATSVKDLEAELATLIDEDALNCRIDSHNKVMASSHSRFCEKNSRICAV